MVMFEELRHEMEKHRWLESEKAGYDLGEAAIRDWLRKHWPGFIRARLLEHLSGQRFWIEMDRSDFGILVRKFPDHAELVRQIVEKVAAGDENLTILIWAVETGRPLAILIEVLQLIDINRNFHRRRSDDDDGDPPHIVQG
jgi:hypothetical protein